MQIDIPAHIEKQLFLRDSIIIPGLGGFTATPTASTVDYVGGSVTPPSKTLNFSENLTTDDGILIQDIAQSHGISTEEARNVVTEFTEQTQQLLNQREIVTLPRIGRLYKNYVQRIQFLPDAANFNAESYGLPPLQFSPIARSREVADTPPAAATGTSVASNTSAAVPLTQAPASLPVSPGPEEEAPRRRNNVWATALSIFLLLGAIGLGIWYWQHQKMIRLANANGTEQPSDATAIRTEKPKKTKPNTAETQQIVETDITAPADEPSPEAVAAAEQQMQQAREEIEKTAVDGRECILVAATLQDKGNADRLVRMLKKNGYQVYFFQKNGFQVGIQFRYHNISEVQDKIIALQGLTGEQNIWIKKK